MNQIYIRSIDFKLLLIFLAVIFMSSCKKAETFENPYEGGKEPLGIKLNLAVLPDPQQASPGSNVTFSATGLMPYKDQIIFTINGQQAEVINVTAAGITVKVPADASTGVATLSVMDQVFFGPKLAVLGKISIDPEFRVSGGANREIISILPVADQRFIFSGNFTDYDGKGILNPINRIVRAFKDGGADLSFRTGGADGVVYGLASVADKYYPAGSFSGFFFNNGRSILGNIRNITRISANGEVDSILVDTYSTNNSTAPGIPATGRKKAVPSFNGGTNSTISRVYGYQNKITATGNFRFYLTNRYNLSKKPVVILGQNIFADSIATDSVETPQVVRFNPDGSLDKSFRFNPATNTGLPGGNGSLLNSLMQDDGKLVIVGNFNRFDEQTAGRIVRLNLNGTVDQTFNSGSGADRSINYVSYNNISKKMLITGTFTSYNGIPAKGIALLNADGSLDQSFTSKGFSSEGTPTFAKQLSDGKIIVSGSFSAYNNIRRAGFIVLSATGELIQGYNAIGDFGGRINDIYETTNSTGKMAVLVIGDFTQIDGTSANRVTRLIFDK